MRTITFEILDDEAPRTLKRGEWGYVESLDYFSLAKFDQTEATSGKYTPCRVTESTGEYKKG